MGVDVISVPEVLAASMNYIGETLRFERERQGRELSEVADKIRITQRYLKAIEKGDLKVLPGSFYYKTFVRQYATVLGLDPSQFSSQLEHLEEEPLPGADPNVPIRTSDPIVAETNRAYFSNAGLSLSVAGLLVVLAGCTGFYAWWYQSQQATPAPAVNTLPVSSPPQSSPAPPTAAVPARTVSATSAPEFSHEMNHVVLNLSAREKTWLSITSEGKVVFSGVLEPSQSKTLQGLESAKVMIGNAGGVEIRLNGKEIGPVGERGEVKVVKFTGDKFTVLPASEL